MSAHTPGPWTWHTSCSWRRLMHDDRGQSSSVLMPVRSQADGHPDIVVRPEDMALIAAAPDLLTALVSLVSALSGDSLSAIDDAEAEALRVIARALDERVPA